MDFWTSANAPWWLSVVTLLIGLFGAHFATVHSDRRRFAAESERAQRERAASSEVAHREQMVSLVSEFFREVENVRRAAVNLAFELHGKIGQPKLTQEQLVSRYAEIDRHFHTVDSVQATLMIVALDTRIARAADQARTTLRACTTVLLKDFEQFNELSKRVSNEAREIVRFAHEDLGFAGRSASSTSGAQ